MVVAGCDVIKARLADSISLNVRQALLPSLSKFIVARSISFICFSVRIPVIPVSYRASIFSLNFLASKLLTLNPALFFKFFCITRVLAASDTSAAYTADNCLGVRAYFSAISLNKPSPLPSAIALAKYSVTRSPFSALTPNLLASSYAAAPKRCIVFLSKLATIPSGSLSLSKSTFKRPPSLTNVGSME